MPVEIREIIIKTEILVTDQHQRDGAREKERNLLKRQLMAECRKLIAKETATSQYKR